MRRSSLGDERDLILVATNVSSVRNEQEEAQENVWVTFSRNLMIVFSILSFPLEEKEISSLKRPYWSTSL